MIIVFILLLLAADITSYHLGWYEVIYATPIVLAVWVGMITSLPTINRMAGHLENSKRHYQTSVMINIAFSTIVGFSFATFLVYNYELQSFLIDAFCVKVIIVQVLTLRVAKDYGKMCEEIRQHERSRVTGGTGEGERRD